MEKKFEGSRRGFVGGLAALLGVGFRPRALWAQGRQTGAMVMGRRVPTVEEYDALAKISANENP